MCWCCVLCSNNKLFCAYCIKDALRRFHQFDGSISPKTTKSLKKTISLRLVSLFLFATSSVVARNWFLVCNSNKITREWKIIRECCSPYKTWNLENSYKSNKLGDSNSAQVKVTWNCLGLRGLYPQQRAKLT